MFKRGFKSQCERRSSQFRKDLGLKDVEPLNAKSLADQLSVTVWSVHDVIGVSSETVKVLNDPLDDSWSAFTLRSEIHHLIVYKSFQSKERINSIIMHELSHIILGHKLARARVLSDGSLTPANYDQDQEDEADWLAGTLLLPRPALMNIRHRRLEDEQACSEFKVSHQMLQWRFRMTGVDRQLKN